jgi:hypothetical protein
VASWIGAAVFAELTATSQRALPWCFTR